MGTPQRLPPWLDPTAGPQRVFPCLAPVLSPMSVTHPHTWSYRHCPMAASHTWPSCLVPCSGPHECSLPGLHHMSPRLFKGADFYSWSLHLGLQPDPRAGPQTVSASWVLTAGLHGWSPSLSLHLSPSLLSTWAGLCRQHHWEPQGHPHCHRATPRLAIFIQEGTTPITAASPSH